MVACRVRSILSASDIADTIDEAASSLRSVHFSSPKGQGWRVAFSEMCLYLAGSVGSWIPRFVGKQGKMAWRKLSMLEDKLWKDVYRRDLIVIGEGSAVTGEGSMSLSCSEQHLSCEGCELMRGTVIRLLHYNDTAVAFVEEIKRSERELVKDVFVRQQSPGEEVGKHSLF